MISKSQLMGIFVFFVGRLQIDHDSLPTKMLFKHMCYEIQYLHGGDSGEATFHDVLMLVKNYLELLLLSI